MGPDRLDHVWNMKAVDAQRVGGLCTKKTGSCAPYQLRECMDRSTSGKVEDESRRPNHSKPHFLPPAWWDEGSRGLSRLIFNTNLYLTQGGYLITSSRNTPFWIVTRYSRGLVFWGCEQIFTVQPKLFLFCVGCISKWCKTRQNGGRGICKNQKCFTGKTWESGLLSNSSKRFLQAVW